MGVTDLLKPLGVFALVIVIILAGTAMLGLATGGSSSTPDGASVDGQSPSDWQPENVVVDSAPEDGRIQVDANTRDKRILVDTRHSNQFSRSDLEPVLDALFRANHEVRFQGSSGGDSFDSPSYNETLQQFDAVLIIAPTSEFSASEVGGLEAYARGGGRVVVLSEPTQSAIGSSGLLGASVVSQRYTGGDLTTEFGMRVGDGILYNVDDDKNDNNFKSIHAATAASGDLTDGVEEVTFDTAGRIVTTRGADTLLTAPPGTTQLETRRTGEYAVAARNDNVVLVADSSFIKTSELYDLDNERFVSNLLRFMVTGDKPDDVPPVDGEDDGFGDDDPTPDDDPTSDGPSRTTVAG